jgi:LysR family transcriptional regulator, regulator for bpeEF and oprC
MMLLGATLERMEYQSPRSLEQLAAFVAVVEAGGFTAAARAQRARKATFSLRVQELEERLGVALLVRSTRSLRLTDEGRAYLEHALIALGAARDADAVVARARAAPSGKLRVTTSAVLASQLLEGVFARYLARYPAVSLELDTSARTVDLGRERFDLAIRVGPLADSSLHVRRLGIGEGGYYASPSYLAQHGTPTHPDQLREHATLCVALDGHAKQWHFASGGQTRTLSVRPRLLVSSFELATRSAALGLGIVRSPHHLAEPYLATKQLVAVLPRWTPSGVELFAVFTPGATSVPKTRALLDMLTEWFASNGRGARAGGSLRAQRSADRSAP